MNQENNNELPNVINKQNKKINIKILCLVIGVIMISIGGFLMIFNNIGNKNQTNIKEITDSNSFWISNNQNLKALFNIDGKQLTDFNYSYTKEFINNVSYVKNKNEEVGLISSSGKMIVDFNKYKYIDPLEAVYVMTDSDFNKYLYNSYGKLVRKLDKSEEVISFTGGYSYVLIKSNSEYIVIDYQGKEITKIPIPKQSESIRPPVASTLDNYTSIFYNKVNYLIDIAKRKVILTIPDTRHFCITSINPTNSKEMILHTCTDFYEDKITKEEIKLIKDGKIAYSKEADTYITVEFKGNNVIYKELSDTYLLDKNGKEKTKDFYISYKDVDNYVKEDLENYNSVDLYVNGTFKEKIKDCNTVVREYACQGIYLLSNCANLDRNGGEMRYINYDGTKLNDKLYKFAYEFDENGYAPVSDDGNSFYLINTKGEKVSDNYSNDKMTARKIYSVENSKKFYSGTNSDGTKTIFEINGKKVVTGDKITTQVVNDDIYAVIEKNNQYIVHNLNSGKDIVTVDEKPYLREKYFTTNKNGKTQFYSYTTGKLFYEN